MLKGAYIVGVLPSFGVCIFLYFANQQIASRRMPISREQVVDISRQLFDLPQYQIILYIQGILAMVVAALIGGAGISSDRRSNALETIFSRAVTRNQYLLGRFLGVVTLVLGATLIPGFFIWLADLLFSADEYRLEATLAYPARIAIWAVEFSVSSTLLVLAFSALIKRAWLGTAAFVVFLLVTFFFINALASAMRRASDGAWEFVRGFSFFDAQFRVQAWILGIPRTKLDTHVSLTSALIWVVALAVLSVFVLYRKVRPIEVVS